MKWELFRGIKHIIAQPVCSDHVRSVGIRYVKASSCVVCVALIFWTSSVCT